MSKRCTTKEAEQWADVVGFEAYYEVSTAGRVRRKSSGLILSTKALAGNGYPVVNFSVNNKKKQMYVHRMVAQAFLPNKDSLPCVNHKDRNKTNNLVENLEWCTYQQNSRHYRMLDGFTYDEEMLPNKAATERRPETGDESSQDMQGDGGERLSA